MQNETTTALAINPTQLLSQAIDKGLGIDQLEKLMSMQERWEKREAEKAFNLAMSEFQRKKPKLIKTKEGAKLSGRTAYKYTPLNDIQKAIDPIASDCGLAYRFEHSMTEGKMIVSCIVTHVGGHSIRCTMEGPAETSGTKNSLQSWGSTRSYLYRYTLEGAFGLSSENDDDGEKSQGKELPFPTKGQWEKILEKFKTGEITTDQIEKSFRLNEYQKKELGKLINGK